MFLIAWTRPEEKENNTISHKEQETTFQNKPYETSHNSRHRYTENKKPNQIQQFIWISLFFAQINQIKTKENTIQLTHLWTCSFVEEKKSFPNTRSCNQRWWRRKEITAQLNRTDDEIKRKLFYYSANCNNQPIERRTVINIGSHQHLHSSCCV